MHPMASASVLPLTLVQHSSGRGCHRFQVHWQELLRLVQALVQSMPCAFFEHLWASFC